MKLVNSNSKEGVVMQKIFRIFKIATFSLLIIFIFATTLVLATGSNKQKDFVMDAVLHINAKGFMVKETVDSAIEIAKNLESVFSLQKETSYVSDLNQGKLRWGDDDLVRCFERAKYFSKLSGGAFDVSIKPVKDLWLGSSVPSADQIVSAKQFVDINKIELGRVLPNGMSIDFGSMARGYAADEAANVLRNRGVKDAIVEFGGIVILIGDKDKKVGIKNPFSDQNDIIGYISTKSKSIVSIENYKTKNRIFDARIGVPVANNIVSVTVICDSAMDGDALANILFALEDRAFPILEELGAQAIIVDNNFRVKTLGIDINITDNTFVNVN